MKFLADKRNFSIKPNWINKLGEKKYQMTSEHLKFIPEVLGSIFELINRIFLDH